MTTKNSELAAQLKAGDEKAYHALILENKGLAMYVVNEFIARSAKAASLKDDLEGEALLALTAGVHQLRTEYDPTKNVTQFLKVVIRRSLAKFLATEDTVSVPQRSQKRAKAKGEDIRVHCESLVADVAAQEPGVVEVVEELQVCANSDSERQVVNLLIAGQTTEQIALNTGLSIQTVQSYARRIRNRFESRSLAL